MFKSSSESVMGFPIAKGFIEPPTSTMPLVSFDISLGKKFSFIDFNYEAYSELLHRIAERNNTDSMDDVSLHFSSGLLSKASFNPQDKKIDIVIPRKTNTRSASRIGTSVIHETQHAVDHRDFEENDPKNFRENVAVFGNVSCLIAELGTLASVGSTIAYVAEKPYGPDALIGSGIATAIGLLGEHVFYTNSVREKRAMEAVNLYANVAPTLITLHK